MGFTVPIMTPIRFRDQTKDPDWITIFPNYQNITQRIEYYKGMYPTQFFKDFVVDRLITLQFSSDSFYGETITVLKYNKSLESYQFHKLLSPELITPSGWVSGDVFKYDFTPTEAGVYKMTYEASDIVSDEFVVHLIEDIKKQLTEISFYNTENDYGMVFYDGTTLKYQGLVFFTGIIDNHSPGNETSSYQSANGGTEILQSSPVHGGTLTLTFIHHSYIDNINHIFSCDRVAVNGIEYGRSESVDIQPISESDLVDIKIKLTKRITEYGTTF